MHEADQGTEECPRSACSMKRLQKRMKMNGGAGLISRPAATAGGLASQRRRRRPSCWVRSREARTERKADCNHSKVGCKNALNFWKEKNQPRIVKMGGAIYTPDLRLMIPEIPLLTHKIRSIFCAYGHFIGLDCIN